MTTDLPHTNTPGFAEVGKQFPEITRHLGRVFDDTTTSYKLFWFRALLETLKRRWLSEPNEQQKPITVGDLVSEMVIAAWHPVCLFHLSLGTSTPTVAPRASRYRRSGSSMTSLLIGCRRTTTRMPCPTSSVA